MSSQIIAAESSIQSIVTQKANQLAHLAESIGYPHSLSAEHIPAIRSSLQNEYHIASQQQHAPTSVFSVSIFRSSVAHQPTSSQRDNDIVESSSGAKFMEWLLDNITAETNWPGFQAHPTSLNDVSADFDRGMDDSQTMQTLDREHAQLQNTLASLEQELADLQSLESETVDTGRILDMDVHDTSVEHDSTVEKLGELAHHVYSKYDPSFQNGATAGSPEFLYLCQQELEHIQLLDQQLVDLIKSIHDFIINSTEFDPTTSASQQLKQPKQNQQHHQLVLFEQLLKQNPEQDKELVRLCSVYRATKMSHIRAMAQLQSLEEQVRYMAEIDAQLTLQQQQEEEQAARDGDATGDHMYTIATAKNKVIQQTRQQEIELISVQREKSRLMDELEQLLSEPDGQRVLESQGVDNEIDPTRRGVLVDICERIARTDIELQYLSAAHQDHVGKQEAAVKDLARIVDQLVEYYGHSQIVEQALAQEQGQIRQHKDVLWALIQELESRSPANEDPPLNKQPINTAPIAHTSSVDFQTLFTTLQRHLDLGAEVRKEKDSLVEMVDQLLRTKSLLLHNVVHQHSTTSQVCFEPAEIKQAKDRLVQRVHESQREYTALESQVQKTILQK
ncbi:hypothetical protein BGZ52_009578 [Haplosporangium bisporale]|nr:hypothetical protein BGZ52_009578 [Haplosporangium bisporale]